MPLELTDAELATAATACRAMAYQEGERAKKMENPTTRGPIESAARRYAELAEKRGALCSRIRETSWRRARRHLTREGRAGGRLTSAAAGNFFK